MMILIGGFLIGLACTFIEVKLVNSWHWLRDKYDNGWTLPIVGFHIPGAWMNNGFSMALSFVMGGGMTVIALMGMVFSTVLSNVYFSAQKAANHAGWTLPRVKADVTKKSEEAIKWWATNKVHFVNLGKTIMAFIKIITAPVRAAIWVNDTAHSGKENLIIMRDKAKVKLDDFRHRTVHQV